jgi:hypothetical protein
MVVRDGYLFGGNAACAFANRYIESGQDIAVEITTLQRNDNLGFKPAAGVDKVGCREGARVTDIFSRAAARCWEAHLPQRC